MNRGRRYENILVLVLFLTFGTIFLDRMAQFYLAPYIIPDLRINDIQIGIMASALAFAWAVSCLVFGAICDRFGRRVILIPAVFAFSLLSWVTGMVETFGQMLLVRVLLGVAEGACYSPLMATIEESSSPERRGRNVGTVVSSAALVGTAVAPILTTQVAAYIGWRWSFFVAGIPGVILGLVIWWYVEESLGKGEPGLVAQKPTLRDYFTVVRYRNVVLCCLAGAANLTSLFFYAVFAPLYITHVAHQAPTTAGFLMGAGGFGAFFAGIFFPALSDRVGRKPVLLLMATGSIFLPLSLLVTPLYGHLWLLAAIEFLLSTSQAITSLVLVLIPTETVPARLAATAIGAATMTAEFVGATIAPAIGGVIAQQSGVGTTLVISAGANVVLLCLTALLKETTGRKAAALQSAAAGSAR